MPTQPLYGLSDFNWSNLANDAYRRYAKLGGVAEDGYLASQVRHITGAAIPPATEW